MTRDVLLLRTAACSACAALSLGINAANGADVRLAEEAILRIGPSESAIGVARARAGAVLDTVREAAPGWTEVSAPSALRCWIYGALVRDGRVAAASVYVRTGPGVENAPMGAVRRGDRITILEEKDGWCRIEAPTSCSLFVRTAALSGTSRPAVVPPRSPRIDDGEEALGAPVPVAGSVPATPAARVAPSTYGASSPSAPASQGFPAPPPGTLGSRVEFSGTVRPAGAIVWRRPSRYRLVSYDQNGRARTLCYLVGDESRLDASMGRRIRVSGRLVDLLGLRYDAVIVEQMSAP